MKRFLSLTVVCLLVASTILSGCGSPVGGSPASGDTGSTAPSVSTPATGDNVTLTFLSWESENVMGSIIKQFEDKNPGIKIDFQHAPPVQEYIEKLQLLSLTNETPDVFVIVLENREELIDNGTVMDLTDKSYMEGVSKLNKQLYSRDGRNYGMAGWAWAGGVFYNEELFAKAGVTEEPTTWAEFVEACAKLKAAGITPILDNTKDAAISIPSALFGAETLNNNPTFDADVRDGKTTYAAGWAKPIQMWYDDMVKPGYFSSSMLGITSDEIQAQFATGQVAMMLNGPWVVPTIMDINPNLKFKVMGVPGTEPGNHWFFGGGGMGYAVNSKTKYPEAVDKFMAHMLSSDSLTQWNSVTGQIILYGDEPTRVQQGMESTEVALKEGKCWIPMFEWRKHTEALRVQYLKALSDIQTGTTTPQQAAESLDAKYAELNK